ncbi:MAG: toll/interleukin-1 receptor domain-containing protein [Rickettsiales bacterium]|nr:toll/interleukin-1 receptor domain-containing protein [Rickettsiales bacterium]MDG4548712.1 toll/interleukin-1 receptor domain-containing protein [Rickettsiales bacterium]
MPTSFLSYCRHVDSCIADEIYGFLTEHYGIDITKDTDDLKYKGDLGSFMEGIRNTDFAILIISEAYLLSTNCMNELLHLLKEQNYLDKALPILTDKSIYNDDNKDKIYGFYHDKITDLSSKIKGFMLEGRDAPEHHIVERKQCREIQDNLDKVMSFISGKLLRTYRELQSKNYIELVEAMGVTPKSLPEPSESTPDVAAGFKGSVRIVKGHISYQRSSLNLPALNGLNVAIIGGSVSKNQLGHTVAEVQTLSPLSQMQNINKQLGLDKFILINSEENKVIEEGILFSLEGISNVTIPANTKITDFNTWKEVSLPFDMPITTVNKVKGTLRGNIFSGTFVGKINMPSLPQPPIIMEGIFEVEVA